MTCHASCCEYGIGRQTMTPTIFKRALFQPHRACVLLSAAMLAGCGREDISVYSVPKEAPHSHAPSLPSGHPDIHSMALARPELKWERLPEGWEAEPAGGMRVASFKVTDPENRSADIAVIPLPAGGSDLELVNLWRGEVQLPPVGADAVEKEASPVEIGGSSGRLFEMSGKGTGGAADQPTRILVALVEREGLNWFFKMKGDDSLVSEQKPAFLAFLRSVSFASAASAVATAHGGTSAGGAHAHNNGRPHWSVPAGWEEVPGGQFLIAKFNIRGEDDAQAAVNVSTSAGDGGGWAANVNRWRQQLGLAPADGAELNRLTTFIDVQGGKANVVDLSGKDMRTGQASRSIGVMVQQPGQAWFYRLVGDAAVVEKQKEAFTQFVRTVDYSHAH